MKRRAATNPRDATTDKATKEDLKRLHEKLHGLALQLECDRRNVLQYAEIVGSLRERLFPRK